jgi:hypothetical protein
MLSSPSIFPQTESGEWVILPGHERELYRLGELIEKEIKGITVKKTVIKKNVVEFIVKDSSALETFTAGYEPSSESKVSVTFKGEQNEKRLRIKDILQKNLPSSLWNFVKPNSPIPPKPRSQPEEMEEEDTSFTFWIYIGLAVLGAILIFFIVYLLGKRILFRAS